MKRFTAILFYALLGGIYGAQLGSEPVYVIAGALLAQVANFVVLPAGVLGENIVVSSGKLRQLKEERASKFEKMEDLMKRSEIEVRDLSKDEGKEWDSLCKELDEMDDQIRRLGTMERRQMEMAMENGTQLSEGSSKKKSANARGWLPEHRNVRVLSNPEDRLLSDKENEGVMLGTYIRWIVNGPANDVEQRALNSLDAGTAKNLVPTPIANQLIDLNRNATVLGRSGAIYITLDTNNYAIPKMTGDVSAAWRNESEVINPGDPTFSKVDFKVKNLGGLVRIAAELFADNTVGLDRQIMRAFTGKFAVEFDTAGLYGDGNKEPVGVTSFAGAQTINKGVNGGAIADYKDIVAAYRMLMDANYTGPTAAIMSPREWEAYTNLVDGDNNPLVMPRGIQNLPWLTTKSMPTTLDAGTSVGEASQIVIGDFTNLVIGIRQQIEMRLLTETFAQNNEFGILCTMRGDIQPLKEDAFVIINNIIPAS